MGRILTFIIAALCFGCHGDRTVPTPSSPTDYLISPIYGDSLYFVVNAKYTDSLSVRGKMDSFSNLAREVHESYFQRFVSKEGSFRKIHAVGTAIEHIRAAGRDTIISRNFDQSVKFDELGIFDGDAADPIELIPLYPGRRIRQQEAWMPRVPVKIAFGSGIASFRFEIDSVYRAENHDLFARIKVVFHATLQPIAALKGAKVSIRGGGWYTWNCTINQRRDTHLSATYSASRGSDRVEQYITSSDSLIVHRKTFKF